VPGGARLAQRGLVLPAGAPRLPKDLTAKSWILVDLDSGAVLAARDPHGRYQPASIQKLLTAVTLLPRLPGRQIVTVSRGAAAAEGSAVGLLAGARYTVDQLFEALLLVSANDAAQALAEANGGLAATVREMNAQAQALGAYDTVAQTPSGLDGWQQLTSAYDMSLFLRAAVNNSRFVHYDQLRSATFTPRSSRYGKVGGYEFDNQSLDFFDTVPGALVAKTGYTDAALHTYACAADRHGRRLGVILLRNERQPLDQYQQAGALLNWGYSLKPTVLQVGRLAGPIAATTTPHATTPGTTSPTASALPAAGSPQRTPRISPHAVVAGAAGAAAGLLLVGTVIGVRRRRRA
jgi:D-alanyl-D-alanine carboxypeptidase (penicillin-binding protein 5/6)